MTDLQLNDAIAELELGAVDTIDIPDAKPALVPTVIQPTLGGEVIVPATAGELADAADRILELIADAKSNMFKVGQELVAIKAKLEHGDFGKWVQASLNGMTERTAQRYMSVVEKFSGKYDTVSVLPTTVIQKLAAPSVPDVLRNQVLAEIDAGNTPTSGAILFRIADAKDKQDKEKAEADKIARKTEGKTPDQAAKIKAKLKAAKASQIAADTAARPAVAARASNREQAAIDAVAFLKQHLGVEFPSFCKLLNTAGYLFNQAMDRTASAKPEKVNHVSEAA
jgi:hypothetical protein